MSDSPPSLRETLSGRTGVVVGVVFVLVVAYSFLALGNVPIVVWFGLVALSVWLVYRFVRAHERIAVAQERRADASERRARAAESRAGVEPRGADRVGESDPGPGPDPSLDDDATRDDTDGGAGGGDGDAGGRGGR